MNFKYKKFIEIKFQEKFKIFSNPKEKYIQECQKHEGSYQICAPLSEPKLQNLLFRVIFELGIFKEDYLKRERLLFMNLG